jgi:pimeloyl-ACP methyl ester carboxylesterase
MRAVSGPAFGCVSAVSRRWRVRGLELHALQWGRPGAPGLCLLHGGAAHAHWFDPVGPVLAARWHVVALDQRGHGQSGWPSPPAYATEDFVADLAGVLDALGWDQAVLVGHSMGGHHALAFAAWHPRRVRGLVVVDARPAIPEERLREMRERGRRAGLRYPTVEAAVAAFRLLPRETVADPELLRHLARMGVVERDGGWTYRFDPEANRQRRPADIWPLLPRITAPTLVVRGEWSPVLPRELARRMVELIPHATGVELAGTYHHLFLDAPARFLDILRPFLDELA